MHDEPAQSLTMTSDEIERLVAQWGDGDPISRRRMLAVMGASLALLGLNGCFYKKPEGKLVPYPKEPAEIVAGRPIYFASAMPFDGFGQGVLALSREGRPIKIEGNPDHPDSLGAADVFMQASLLDLYDPDRSRHVTCAGQVEQWSQFYEALRVRLDNRQDHAGVRLLTGTVTSPTLAAQIDEFTKKKYPGSRWHVHDPIRRADETSNASPFAEPVNVVYDLTQADVIVSLDADFLYKGPGHLRYARQFIDGRRVREAKLEMNRLYVVESTLTITGSMADHRLPVRPSRITAVARALAQKIGAPVSGPAPS